MHSASRPVSQVGGSVGRSVGRQVCKQTDPRETKQKRRIVDRGHPRREEGERDDCPEEATFRQCAADVLATLAVFGDGFDETLHIRGVGAEIAGAESPGVVLFTLLLPLLFLRLLLQPLRIFQEKGSHVAINGLEFVPGALADTADVFQRGFDGIVTADRCFQQWQQLFLSPATRRDQVLPAS